MEKDCSNIFGSRLAAIAAFALAGGLLPSSYRVISAPIGAYEIVRNVDVPAHIYSKVMLV
jgi:hypothetical protein